MAKRYVLNLSVEEREGLEGLLKRGRVSGLKTQRARILLAADEGITDEEVSEQTGVNVTTVERIRKRCALEGVAASLERKKQERPSRERKLDGVAEARLSLLACSPPPEGRASWTLALLADKLVELSVVDECSKSTVQRGLKKTQSNRG
jgi:transposase